jgi:hypothetical protein
MVGMWRIQDPSRRENRTEALGEVLSDGRKGPKIGAEARRAGRARGRCAGGLKASVCHRDPSLCITSLWVWRE